MLAKQALKEIMSETSHNNTLVRVQLVQKVKLVDSVLSR